MQQWKLLILIIRNLFIFLTLEYEICVNQQQA